MNTQITTALVRQTMKVYNPYDKTEGVKYGVQCDGCGVYDFGDTIKDLESAMYWHICKYENEGEENNG